MKYEVKGRIQIGRVNQIFTKEVEAENEELAKTLVLSDFGGKYRINRRKIKIEGVTAQEGGKAPSKPQQKGTEAKESEKEGGK